MLIRGFVAEVLMLALGFSLNAREYIAVFVTLMGCAVCTQLFNHCLRKTKQESKDRGTSVNERIDDGVELSVHAGGGAYVHCKLVVVAREFRLDAECRMVDAEGQSCAWKQHE